VATPRNDVIQSLTRVHWSLRSVLEHYLDGTRIRGSILRSWRCHRVQ
jgi:hypothetical protein